MSDILIDEVIPGVRRLTLNRPEQLNAFTIDTYAELIDILRSLKHDTKTRVVLLTGNGRAFCAGHDLRSSGWPQWLDDHEVGPTYRSRHNMSEMASIPVLMRQLPQPVIAVVNGATAGIGFALALAADMCIAAKSAKFVNSIHNVGTGHELGMSYLLPRAVGAQRAAEILLTARPILADEAERIGLVLRAVPDEDLMDAALEIARNVLANVPIGVWLTKQTMWLNQTTGSLDAAIELESRAVFMARNTQDAAEKRQSFLEKRSPVFTNK
ncbi:MAG TPA: enoyl-CoA hydratase-related protein [Novosphingobium sp.]|nr:enoyl-CoA hydratase-related protein [Novosphingobium sp.]